MFVLNCLSIIFAIFSCCLLSLHNFPGMELLGVSPNWFLILVITWSIKRSIWSAALGGLVLGWIYDGLIFATPSHAFALVTIGVITASLNKDKYIEDNFISVLLIVFVMAIISETVFALQNILWQVRTPIDIWRDYLRIAFSSAVITSLWAPILYVPLTKWWQIAKQ